MFVFLGFWVFVFYFLFLFCLCGRWMTLPQSTRFYISSNQEISLSFIHSSIHQMLVALHMIYPEEWHSTPGWECALPIPANLHIHQFRLQVSGRRHLAEAVFSFILAIRWIIFAPKLTFSHRNLLKALRSCTWLHPGVFLQFFDTMVSTNTLLVENRGQFKPGLNYGPWVQSRPPLDFCK